MVKDENYSNAVEGIDWVWRELMLYNDGLTVIGITFLLKLINCTNETLQPCL
jgi:hypothetical protein